MKYIGTVVDNYAKKDRTETLISIEGLARHQQIAVLWSIPRSPDALVELTPGTRIIFAAKEGTMNQRVDTDEHTGALSTILVAVGLFYDVIADTDTRSAEEMYESIAQKDLELDGTITSNEVVDGNRTVVLTMPRHGRHQGIELRWPAELVGAAEQLSVGDEVAVTAVERSLTWTIHIDDAGRRAIVPAVTVTGLLDDTREV
jgi:hypothetical protein